MVVVGLFTVVDVRGTVVVVVVDEARGSVVVDRTTVEVVDGGFLMVVVVVGGFLTVVVVVGGLFTVVDVRGTVVVVRNGATVCVVVVTVARALRIAAFFNFFLLALPDASVAVIAVCASANVPFRGTRRTTLSLLLPTVTTESVLAFSTTPFLGVYTSSDFSMGGNAPACSAR